MYYDYLIVGAGLYGAVFAHEMNRRGKKCLVIDKREHIAGNIYTKKWNDIDVHWYGAHIFHTSDERVWEYVNQFARFNHFVNSPIAVYKDELYNLPFNMNTFSKLWGIRTPLEAQEKIKEQVEELGITQANNLEEHALSMVGTDVYEKLIKGYTEKQWGRDCKDLPAFIIKRLPLRFTYDNNYFNDIYQGIPVGGYTEMVKNMLEGVTLYLKEDYKEFCAKQAADPNGIRWGKVVYTGMIDEYFDYRLGELEYRSLRFEHELIEKEKNYQGNAVVNYTEREIPYTRIIEHKHFAFGTQKDTVITREYPAKWEKGDEPYYPINDEKNSELYENYRELAKGEKDVIFGGRLGSYKYYDMDKVIIAALEQVEEESDLVI